MKVTKRITMSVLTLVLTVIALGTITFAWFSLSTVSNVSNISGSVRGGEGLEVRLITKDLTLLDDDNKPIATQWKSNLNKDDVEAFIIALTAAKRAAIEDNAEIFTFNAVSTIDEGANFTKMTQEGEKTVVNGAPAVSNIDYLEFNIEFRSATEGTVRFSSYELSGTGAAFVPDVEYTQIPDAEEDTMNKVKNDPSNGARFLLENGAAIAYQKPAENYPEKIEEETLITGNSASNDLELDYGQYSYLTDGKGMDLFYMTDETNYAPVPSDFDGITMLPAAEDWLEDNATTVDLSENDDSVATNDAYIASLTIKIWIEGWDADTYDAFYNGQLVVNLTFVKDPVEPDPEP